MQMIHTQKPNNLMDPKQVLALILIMILFSAFYPVFQASGEALIVEDDEADAYISPEDWGDSFVILDDPELFDYEATLQEMPVITSEGKTNVKVHGVKSKGKLVRYTIPKELLWADPDFLALMIEAEKYAMLTGWKASTPIGTTCKKGKTRLTTKNCPREITGWS